MSQIVLMFGKEWLNFVRGDRSVFIVYLVLVAGWGALLASMHTDAATTAPLWIVFFSVIIAANFSSTVFVLERMSGSLEILLTSGMSRSAILYGKMLFVVVMTLAIGFACLACALPLRRFFPVSGPWTGAHLEGADIAFFISATLCNTASSAYFSVVLPNPRLLHFINLLLLGLIMVTYMTLAFFRPFSPYIVVAVLVLLAVVFTALAKREFDSEKIVKPVVL